MNVDWSFITFKYPKGWEQIENFGGYVDFSNPNDKSFGIDLNQSTDVNISDPRISANRAITGDPEAPLVNKNITVDGHPAVYIERRQIVNEDEKKEINVYVGDVKDVTKFLAQDGGPKITNGVHHILATSDKVNIEKSRETFDLFLSTIRYHDPRLKNE